MRGHLAQVSSAGFEGQLGRHDWDFDFWNWSMAKLEPAQQLASDRRFEDLLTRAAAR